MSGAKGQGGRATGGPFAGPARELGPGWKVSPFLQVPARSTITLADIEGAGALQHLWNTARPPWWRRLILRFYWDDEAMPSIEAPRASWIHATARMRC